jgi:hypothetical protein
LCDEPRLHHESDILNLNHQRQAGRVVARQVAIPDTIKCASSWAAAKETLLRRLLGHVGYAIGTTFHDVPDTLEDLVRLAATHAARSFAFPVTV